MAWQNLGASLRVLGMLDAADSAQERSWNLRDHLSDWERLTITGAYYGFPGQRNPVKAAAAFQELLDRGDSNGALGNLGTLRLNQRDYARAEPLLRAAARQSGSVVAKLNLVPVLYHLGKVAEAQAVYDTARSQTRAFPLVPRWAAEFAYQRGDFAAVEHIADSVAAGPMPTQKIWGVRRLADLAILRGQVAPYERAVREAAAAEKARNNGYDPVVDSILFAYRDVWMSPSPSRGIARLDAAIARRPLDQSVDVDYRFLAAITYAIGGHADRARAIIARYDTEKMDSVQRRLKEPSRHRVMGEIALAEKHWPVAFAEFRRSDTTALGNPADVCRTCLFALLGRAFDQAGMADSAIVMYEKYLSTPYFMRGTETHIPQLGMSDPFWLPPIHKRLGELYEQKGDRARATAQYSQLLELWKDADPEFHPTLTAVRERLSGLSGR